MSIFYPAHIFDIYLDDKMADQEQNNSATTEEAPAQPEVQEQVQDKEQTPQEEAPQEQQPTEETPAEQPVAPSIEVEPAQEAEADSAEKAPEEEVKDETVKEGETKEDGQVKEGGEEAVEGEKPAEEEVKTEEGAENKEGDPKPEGETAEGEKTETAEAADGADGGEVQEKQPDDAEATQPADGEQVAEGEEKPGESGEGEKKEEGGEEEQKVEGEAESKSPVPQSDTFAEGERAESPVGVGEKLSREGSPTEQVEVKIPDKLEPGTPERSRPGSVEGDKEPGHLTTFDEGEEDEEEEEEEEEEQPEFDREELIERYHQAIAEREQLQQQNYQLQHKLAEYFRKKKADESRQEYDKNVTDQEQRYLKYMAQLEDLRRQDMQERDSYKHQITDLKSRCEEKKEKVDEERLKFMEFKKQVALNALNSRSGRPIPPKDIESYLAAENRKESEVVNVRLENIKLKNRLKKKEHQLKSKEELAEGLHLIDFEQLKIENQTYNEKIEERNEELLKLRKKITSTVQVLTHLKEKLQYVQAENQVQKRNLRDVEAEVAQKRDILSRTKQARDALRIDNQRLRQNCGLLGNEALLRDFEERKDEGDDLRDKLERLKMQHAELTLHCNQVRRKIEQARSGRA